STAVLQVDEGVARDLLGETRAPLAHDAPLAVKEDRTRQSQGLLEGALDVDKARLGTAMAQRLILEGALAALVTDRAVERVVDEEKLDDALLGTVCFFRRVLGVDHHAVGDSHRARGLRL